MRRITSSTPPSGAHIDDLSVDDPSPTANKVGSASVGTRRAAVEQPQFGRIGGARAGPGLFGGQGGESDGGQELRHPHRIRSGQGHLVIWGGRDGGSEGRIRNQRPYSGGGRRQRGPWLGGRRRSRPTGDQPYKRQHAD